MIHHRRKREKDTRVRADTRSGSGKAIFQSNRSAVTDEPFILEEDNSGTIKIGTAFAAGLCSVRLLGLVTTFKS